MSSSPHADAARIRLPRRAVLVSESPERAAAMAADFDDVRIATPATVEATLAEFGPVECVGILGMPIDDGTLRAVVASVLRAGTDGLSVFLDIADPSGQQLVHGDASPLAGLAVAGTTTVAGTSSLVFARSTDGSVPDLAPFRDGRPSIWSGPDRAFTDADRLSSDVTVRSLHSRIAELEAELATSELALTTAQRALSAARTSRPRKNPAGPAPGSTTSRWAQLGIAGAAVVAVAAAAGLLALLTSTGYMGGLLTAAVLVGAGFAGYTTRALRRLARTATRTSAEVQQLAGAYQVLSTKATELPSIKRQIELASASALDIARTVARLADEARTPANGSDATTSLPSQ